MIEYSYYVVNFISINIIVSISLYYDIKYRRIPHYLFKYSCLIILAINIIDFITSAQSVFFFVLIKALILLFNLFITLILFNYKFIGGADGKLIITLFLLIPIRIFNFRLIFIYFLWFFLCLFLLILFNYMINQYWNNKIPFEILFMTKGIISKSKRIYMISFYSFFNYSTFFSLNSTKHLLMDINLFFNYKTTKLQLLVKYRPPIIILIAVLFYLLYFL
jgi:Flp pilus assembly protein protease CpaA